MNDVFNSNKLPTIPLPVVHSREKTDLHRTDPTSSMFFVNNHIFNASSLKIKKEIIKIKIIIANCLFPMELIHPLDIGETFIFKCKIINFNFLTRIFNNWQMQKV